MVNMTQTYHVCCHRLSRSHWNPDWRYVDLTNHHACHVKERALRWTLLFHHWNIQQVQTMSIFTAPPYKGCDISTNVTQYNKRYIMSNSEKVEMFAISNRTFNKLSNNAQFLKIELRLLEIQLLQSVYFLSFSLYFAHYFVHYLRINLANKMYNLLYCVTCSSAV